MQNTNSLTVCACAEVSPSPLQSAGGCRALQLRGGNRGVTMVPKEQTGSSTSQGTGFQTEDKKQDLLSHGEVNWS